MILQVLEESGRRLVTPELASGNVARWPETAWLPFVSDMTRRVEIGELESIVDNAMKTFERKDSGIDAWLAPRLHRGLPLTRREASNAGLWRYLAVVRRPDFIRHRWGDSSWATMRPRFWSLGLRHDSITFARLWWIAELSRDGDDYALTERVFARQSLAISLFVRSWGWHRPAIVATISALDGASAETTERVVRALTRYLATVPLEVLSEKELRDVVVRLRDGSTSVRN